MKRTAPELLADTFSPRVQKVTLPGVQLLLLARDHHGARGSTTTLTLTVTPSGGFNRPVSLRAGCPSRAACTPNAWSRARPAA